jgi:uncharacterized protein YyaL (SSP411 family)
MAPVARNRLADATSPYLLQHQDNLVDWREWGDDAFAEARRRDVPVLLSIGYAACHWCHVMAHESFEDAATAEQMNAGFVCVKVDREERPDVDAVYMEATQAMTGQGGWPMTVFTTPDGEPFFCGTYFPPADRMGMPSFRRVLTSVTEAWTERRDEVAGSGRDIVRRLDEAASRAPASGGRIGVEQLDAAAQALRSAYDDQHGGFGRAPKFPAAMAGEFLLRQHARNGDAGSLRMATYAAERMARGGIYDQLAGGFARYSVDATWVVPHFEKMLYDNALLLRMYAHVWRATGDPLARRVAAETAGFLLRDLRTAEGGFASSLDADAAGEEGSTYVWTPDEVGSYAVELFGVTEAGTFEGGRSVLQLPRDPDDPERFAAERSRLLAIRDGRPQPARDDKVVAAWNGLAIAALAETGALYGEPAWVDAARGAAELACDLHLSGGRLARTSRNGRVGANAGVLDDYADVAEGLLALHQATGERRWLDTAGELLDAVLERFADGDGGFFDTADDAERLVRRPRELTDGPVPSGTSAAAGALLTYAALTGSARHREAAESALAAYAPILERQPRFAAWAAAVGEALVAGPLEIAVVDAPALAEVARRTTSPGAVVVTGGDSPLLADRPPGAAYVCRNFTCDAPTRDPAALAGRIGARRA